MITKFGIPNGLTYKYAKTKDYMLAYISTVGFIVSLGVFTYLTIFTEEYNPGWIDLISFVLSIIFCYSMIWHIKYIENCISEEDD